MSIVSLWEITVKRRVGKMDADPIRLIDRLPSQGFDRLGIEDPHLRALDGLPAYHRDPFDHLLIAQAIAEGAAFMSRDRKADRYPVELVSPVR